MHAWLHLTYFFYCAYDHIAKGLLVTEGDSAAVVAAVQLLNWLFLAFARHSPPLIRWSWRLFCRLDAYSMEIQFYLLSHHLNCSAFTLVTPFSLFTFILYIYIFFSSFGFQLQYEVSAGMLEFVAIIIFSWCWPGLYLLKIFCYHFC